MMINGTALGMDEAADQLISAGTIAPLIIVMPQETIIWKIHKFPSMVYAFVDELLPWVDANYPTIPGRQTRAIGGLSSGAGWAMRMGLMQPRPYSAASADTAWLNLKEIISVFPDGVIGPVTRTCQGSTWISDYWILLRTPPGYLRHAYQSTLIPMNGILILAAIQKSTGLNMSTNT